VGDIIGAAKFQTWSNAMPAITLSETRNLLREVTKGCRPDMHEPDNQGLQAQVIGWELDNAFGNQITIEKGFQEFVVILERDGKRTCFNLATIIALARLATVKPCIDG
jgi:hypothetical protein